MGQRDVPHWKPILPRDITVIVEGGDKKRIQLGRGNLPQRKGIELCTIDGSFSTDLCT